MKIGYACIPMGVNNKSNRGFLLKNFSAENFIKTTALNLSELLRILQYNISNRILLFRISSDIIPFGSHPINAFCWQTIFKNELEEIGKYILNNNIRVSMHPGQYTVLNSINKETVSNAVRDIEYHADFLDALGVPYSSKIVIHIGGVYNNKKEAIERFIQHFELLSLSAKKRIIIENDEKSFTIEDVLYISNKLNIPVVFDVFHHQLNPSLSENLHVILTQVNNTWKQEDGVMKLHYSEHFKGKKKGSHSNTVLTKNFISFYQKIYEFQPDIMLEVKDKDLSAIKCINSTSNAEPFHIYSQWAKYKYVVMEKDYGLYKKCRAAVRKEKDISHLYDYIDSALMLPFNSQNYLNTLLHVWGYFSTMATAKEKSLFFKLVQEEDWIKAKKNLFKLTQKYKETYLSDSYYFIYS
jgi:UV DNA damage endonuclease